MPLNLVTYTYTILHILYVILIYIYIYIDFYYLLKYNKLKQFCGIIF